MRPWYLAETPLKRIHNHAKANELLTPVNEGDAGTLGEHGPWRQSVRSSLEVRAERRKDQSGQGQSDSDADNEPNGTPIRRGFEGTDSGLAPQGTTLNRPLIHPTLSIRHTLEAFKVSANGCRTDQNLPHMATM